MKLAEPLGIKGWSAIAATWVGIAGGGFGLYTAINDNQEAAAKAQALAEKEFGAQIEAWEKEISGQTAQTLKMYEIFNSSELLRSREKVYDYLNLSETAQAGLKLNDVLIYFDFFDALKLCMEQELCDKPTAARLFKGYAIDAWVGLGPQIVGLREEDPERGFFYDPVFGEGVQWLKSLDDNFEPDSTQLGAEQTDPELVSDAVPEEPEQ